jgi:hypothetical protein
MAKNKKKIDMNGQDSNKNKNDVNLNASISHITMHRKL